MKNRRQVHNRLTSWYVAPPTHAMTLGPRVAEPCPPLSRRWDSRRRLSKSSCLSVSFSLASCGTSVLSRLHPEALAPPKDTHPGAALRPNLSPCLPLPPAMDTRLHVSPLRAPARGPEGNSERPPLCSLQRLPPAGQVHTHTPPRPWGLWVSTAGLLQLCCDPEERAPRLLGSVSSKAPGAPCLM